MSWDINTLREFGSFGVVVYCMLQLMGYIKRLVVSVEKMSNTFIVHDERSVMLFKCMGVVEEDIKEIKCTMVVRSDMERLHERLDLFEVNKKGGKENAN